MGDKGGFNQLKPDAMPHKRNLMPWNAQEIILVAQAGSDLNTSGIEFMGGHAGLDGFQCILMDSDGGFTGLHPSGTWSTWSPGRFLIPDAEEEFYPALAMAVQASANRPQIEGGYRHPLLPDRRIALTCGNCHLICVADKEERAKRYKSLRESGCVVQNPDGSLEAVSAEEATERLAAMDSERRLMYESF